MWVDYARLLKPISQTTPMATTADPLISYLFDDNPHRLSGLFNGWLTAAPQSVYPNLQRQNPQKIRVTHDLPAGNDGAIVP